MKIKVKLAIEMPSKAILDDLDYQKWFENLFKTTTFTLISDEVGQSVGEITKIEMTYKN